MRISPTKHERGEKSNKKPKRTKGRKEAKTQKSTTQNHYTSPLFSFPTTSCSCLPCAASCPPSHRGTSSRPLTTRNSLPPHQSRSRDARQAKQCQVAGIDRSHPIDQTSPGWLPCLTAKGRAPLVRPCGPPPCVKLVTVCLSPLILSIRFTSFILPANERRSSSVLCGGVMLHCTALHCIACKATTQRAYFQQRTAGYAAEVSSRPPSSASALLVQQYLLPSLFSFGPSFNPTENVFSLFKN